MDCYLLNLPMGVDVNQYALQADDPSQALGAIIRKAEWLGKGTGRPCTVPDVRTGCRRAVDRRPAESEPDEDA